ncbi:MAG: hypothetical protein U0Q03_13615 [Acidimicrobiales bacterium]
MARRPDLAPHHTSHDTSHDTSTRTGTPGPTRAARPTGRLRDDPAGRRAVAALGLFELAEYAAWVAVLVLAYRRGGVMSAGTVSTALLVPAALVAPFAARELRLPGLPNSLTAGYALQALALTVATVVLALDLHTVFVYLALTAVMVAAVCSRPAHHEFLAGRDAPAEVRVAATVATGSVTGAGHLLGPLVAAATIAIAGPTAVFGVCALLHAVSALLASALPPTAMPPHRSRGGAPVGHGRSELAARRSGRCLAPLAMIALTTVLLGTVEAMATEVSWRNGTGGAGTGLLLGAAGAGLLLGAQLAGVAMRRADEHAAIRLGAVVSGLALLCLGPRVGTIGSVLAFGLVGVGLQAVTVASWVLLHRGAGPGCVARTFGLVESQQLVGYAIGAMVAGIAVDRVGVWPVLVPTALLLPLAAVPLGRARSLAPVHVAST